MYSELFQIAHYDNDFLVNVLQSSLSEKKIPNLMVAFPTMITKPIITILGMDVI